MDYIVSQALRKQGQMAFRKRLGVYSYKLKYADYFKRPGMINLHTKEQLKKQGVQGRYKIFKMERDSERQFGEFSSRSKFLFDSKRVPFLDVPDLTGFELKPYVSVHTPKIELEDIIKIYKLNDYKDATNFGRFTQLEVPSEETNNAAPKLEASSPKISKAE